MRDAQSMSSSTSRIFLGIRSSFCIVARPNHEVCGIQYFYRLQDAERHTLACQLAGALWSDCTVCGRSWQPSHRWEDFMAW